MIFGGDFARILFADDAAPSSSLFLHCFFFHSSWSPESYLQFKVDDFSLFLPFSLVSLARVTWQSLGKFPSHSDSLPLPTWHDGEVNEPNLILIYNCFWKFLTHCRVSLARVTWWRSGRWQKWVCKWMSLARVTWWRSGWWHLKVSDSLPLPTWHDGEVKEPNLILIYDCFLNFDVFGFCWSLLLLLLFFYY